MDGINNKFLTSKFSASSMMPRHSSTKPGAPMKITGWLDAVCPCRSQDFFKQAQDRILDSFIPLRSRSLLTDENIC
jgi:hypothetical protein